MDWKGIADQAMKDIAEMRAELNEQDKEIERLKKLLSIAYHYGVRAEIDLVTGEICRHWMEESK